MDLIQLIILIAVVGLIVWALVTYVPMSEPFKKAIVSVAVIGLLIYVLQLFGLVPHIHVGK